MPEGRTGQKVECLPRYKPSNTLELYLNILNCFFIFNILQPMLLPLDHNSSHNLSSCIEKAEEFCEWAGPDWEKFGPLSP